MKSRAKQICRVAVYVAFMYGLELAMTFLPNIQFTQLLLTVYVLSFGLKESLVMTALYVTLDNIVMGSFSVVYSVPMYVGWTLLVFALYIISRKTTNRFIIGAAVGVHAIIYAVIFAIFSCTAYHMPFWAYIVSDVPFTAILVANGVLTVVLFCPLLTKFAKKVK